MEMLIIGILALIVGGIGMYVNSRDMDEFGSDMYSVVFVCGILLIAWAVKVLIASA